MAPATPASTLPQRPDSDNATAAAHKLVARFLRQAGELAPRFSRLTAAHARTTGYKDTLASFQRESAVEHPELSLSDASLTSTQPDLRDVVESWISSRIASLSIAPAPLEAELHDLELNAAIPEKVSSRWGLSQRRADCHPAGHHGHSRWHERTQCQARNLPQAHLGLSRASVQEVR